MPVNQWLEASNLVGYLRDFPAQDNMIVLDSESWQYRCRIDESITSAPITDSESVQLQKNNELMNYIESRTRILAAAVAPIGPEWTWSVSGGMIARCLA